ncbi:ABC transporter ATP-binding protein [Treponema sp. OMZ 840]|uniref:ABC transporter ATP-binding protein n=1 Tax=Treponema sp. OMZ 840 TaxID=244313 RepID=UPI003D91345E
MSYPIMFDTVIKKYDDGMPVIPGLSLKVHEGEFFTLLGPSGCGKTTLLRMVAGFNTIEGGTISFNNQIINNVPPSKRNIGMVFQDYAVFPHLSVFKNVAFGLQERKISNEEINCRVNEILKTVHIEELKDRLPQNMSGGQQQRIALARAIVIRPDVLLMDEPLSNLDAKLRIEMRNAIREIQHSIGITTIYVTHDQEEALAISDRIGVMNQGVLQHVGTPKNIYQRPANLFVATFIGRSNVIEAQCIEINKSDTLQFYNNYTIKMDNMLPEAKNIGTVKVSIRPEEFCISRHSKNGIEGVIKDSVFLGLNTHYFITLSDGREIETISESDIAEIIPKNTKVHLQIKSKKINVFTKDGSKNLVQGVEHNAN